MSKKLTYEYVKEYIESNGCKLLDKKYINIDSKLKIKFCCEHINKQSFYKFKIAKTHLCKKCAGSIKYNINDILKIIGDKGYIFINGNYETNQSKLSVSDKNGYKYYVSLSGIRKTNIVDFNGKVSGLSAFDYHNIYTMDNIKKWLKDNKLTYVIIDGIYKNAHAKTLKMKCNLCENEWYANWNNIKNGKGCPWCTISKGENEIIKLLTKNKLIFLRNHFFNECKAVAFLTFDFYLIDKRIIIEYNGKQHYEPVEFFGGIKSFENQQFHDQIKRDYCRKNNIKLVEIPYWDFNNIESILSKELKMLTMNNIFMKGGS